jgi:hypothetical protein
MPLTFCQWADRLSGYEGTKARQKDRYCLAAHKAKNIDAA